MSQPPRIVIPTHEFYPRSGGIGSYCLGIARAAAAEGHPVEVWAPRDPRLAELRVPFAVRGVPVRWSQQWPSRLMMMAEFLRRRATLASSILYLAEPGALRAFAWLDRLSPVRCGAVVLTVHGSEVLTMARFGHRRRFFQRLLDRSARVGTVSRYTRELLTAAFSVGPERLVHVPGAPRLPEDEAGAPRQPARRDGRDGRLALLTVGRVAPRKGQLETVAGLAALDPGIKGEVRYDIVGPAIEGGYCRRVRERARRCGVEVRFRGELSRADLADAYGTADAFIMTSREHRGSVEGYGIVYLEAGAHGLPCIAGRSGGAAEAVRDGETGIVVDSRSPAQIAAAVTTLLRDPGLRARLGAAGREWARAHSWERNVERLFGGLDLP